MQTIYLNVRIGKGTLAKPVMEAMGNAPRREPDCARPPPDVIDLSNAVAMSYTVVAHGLIPAGANCGVQEVAWMAGTSPRQRLGVSP